MDEILKNWHLSDAEIELIYESKDNKTWVISDKYYLKFYGNIQELDVAVRVNTVLSNHGIPVVTYKKTENGEITPDRHHVLMHKIKGEHLTFESIMLDEMKNLGRGVATLHQGFSQLEKELVCPDNDYLAEWNGYIKSGLIDVRDEIVTYIDEQLHKHYNDLPRNIIHRDIHLGNVLIDAGVITGWLDFDLTRKDIRIFDIAYLMTGLLLGRIDDKFAILKWQDLLQNFIAGYESVANLEENEHLLLPVMMIAMELLFVTYWGSLDNDAEVKKANALAEWLYDAYVG